MPCPGESIFCLSQPDECIKAINFSRRLNAVNLLMFQVPINKEKLLARNYLSSNVQFLVVDHSFSLSAAGAGVEILEDSGHGHGSAVGGKAGLDSVQDGLNLGGNLGALADVAVVDGALEGLSEFAGTTPRFSGRHSWSRTCRTALYRFTTVTRT